MLFRSDAPRRWLLRAATLFLAGGLALAAPLSSAQAAKGGEEADALAYSQEAIGRVVGDQRLTDADGQPLRLADLRGRPVVLNLIYTGCGDVCPLVMDHVARAVAEADRALGPGRFAVLTVGFDWRADTPTRMHDYRSEHRINRADWRLASGDSAAIERLAADIGFYYTPRAGGFDHLAQTTLLDADGRVYRQIYGDFIFQALVDPLRELLFGQPVTSLTLTTVANRLRFLCTVYDPSSGRYRFSYAIFIGLTIGFACLAGTAAFLVSIWRTRKV